MKRFLILIFGIAVSLCFNCCRRSKYRNTDKLQNGIFIEKFSTGIIGNLTAEYLTDSTNFRIYVGVFDDESEHFYFKVVEDSIFYTKNHS